VLCNYVYINSYLNLTYFYLDVLISVKRTSSEKACSVLLPVLAMVMMIHMCGSACSCPHLDSLNAVPPFGYIPPPWSTWCSYHFPCPRLLIPASWSHGCHDLHGQSRLIYFLFKNWIDADFLWKVCLLLPLPLSCVF